eukprot:COSAG02_NODE_1926_length_10341_cov_25.525776_5_plen_133_part_00
MQSGRASSTVPALVLQRLSARNTEYSDTQDTFMRFVANARPSTQTFDLEAAILHSNNVNVGVNAYGPIPISADTGGLGATRAHPFGYLTGEAAKIVRQTRAVHPLPPVRLGKRGKPTPLDWRRCWSAQCKAI